ncbi:serine/threonine-protein kinase [Nonomuraea zeae]|uniref:non-specific serine/threonine protein kinase n=1 Tax=Nonomuraea zeae TaxID=1642303 RepID=A0A5S4G7T5_9ACTN|nr:serine/threonine-protein kinase [Nonomuraea zeae]TMR28922.1 serine/threonine protein kinase [Nonomuraea zeae]
MSELSVPGYEIKGVLGQGGFGVVYLALQTAVGREVALKVDNRVLLSDRDRRRFMREVTAAGALSGHPHVVPVYDAGLLPDGRPYMVLELCPGGSLSGRILSPAEARDVGVRIADALAAAHAQGVLHRDVKPGNLLLNRYGQVALSDFGLATMPATGPEASVTRESLTPSYAPPEAFELAEPTPAGDVYALAGTVYALLSGRPPRFPASGVPNLAMILALHRLPVPDIPGVPPELTAVLRQALAGDLRVRTPSAEAFRNALAAVPLATSPPPISLSAAPPPSPHSDTRPPARHGQSKALVSIAAAVALVISIGVGVIVYSYLTREPDSQHAALGGTTSTTSPGTATKKTPFTGLDTYTQDCPAAKVRGAGAACVRESECWGGLVIIAGDTKARRVGCEETHSWETFAVAAIPADADTYVQQDLAKHPTVKRTCSRAVLLATRTGTAKTLGSAGWDVDVMPPSQAQFENGVRFYRCIGGRTGQEPRKSFFH